MNIKENANQVKFIRKNPKKSFVGFIFFTAIVLYTAVLVKTTDYAANFLKDDSWRSQKVVVGKTWHIETLEERFDRFNFKLNKITGGVAEIEISSPTIGMYMSERITISESFIHIFQSGKYFYKFVINVINSSQGFISADIYRDEQST